MARASLRRLLRGSTKRAIEDVCALAATPLRIEDETGKVLAGAPEAEGDRHEFGAEGTTLGAVIGGPGAERVARILAHLCEREDEKIALAEETLGRYKELTLLYDISDKLSRVLEVDEVARMVVEEARAFLGASGVSLMMLDRRRNVLEAIASTDGRPRLFAATAGIEGRVLKTGRAELIEDLTTTDIGTSEPGVTSMMAAPLRTGETVFGILRVTTSERSAWTAGHLKLVTSLAANAASAISHAMLHRDRLRQQALRYQIERFVSAEVLDAAFAGGEPGGAHTAAALFCDASELTHYADPSVSPEQLRELVVRATTTCASVLIREGATVQISQAELLVALFVCDRGLPHAAQAAVRAAQQIVQALERRSGGFAERAPSVAITYALLPADGPAPAFFAAVGAAANLQALADGRILVDEQIAEVLGEHLRSSMGETSERGEGGSRIYEVRA